MVGPGGFWMTRGIRILQDERKFKSYLDSTGQVWSKLLNSFSWLCRTKLRKRCRTPTELDGRRRDSPANNPAINKIKPNSSIIKILIRREDRLGNGFYLWPDWRRTEEEGKKPLCLQRETWSINKNGPTFSRIKLPAMVSSKLNQLLMTMMTMRTSIRLVDSLVDRRQKGIDHYYALEVSAEHDFSQHNSSRRRKDWKVCAVWKKTAFCQYLSPLAGW